MDTESDLSIKRQDAPGFNSSWKGGRLDTKPVDAICVIHFIIYLGPFPPEQKHILVFSDFFFFYLHLNG